MVVGIDKFAAHFQDFESQYRLIGGTATWLLLDDAGLEVRATKDLDIVLCVEAMTPEFAESLWEFIRAGKYEISQRADGTPIFYRFIKPAEVGYPVMLELFSRVPDIFPKGIEGTLTPLPLSESTASLSAILLDDDYYQFILQNGAELRGVQIANEYCLIPLKARAWLDLTERRSEGEAIDRRDINKHRSDVFRLVQLLNPSIVLPMNERIQSDLNKFLEQVWPEIDKQQLVSWGIQGITPTQVLETMRNVYCLSN